MGRTASAVRKADRDATSTEMQTDADTVFAIIGAGVLLTLFVIVAGTIAFTTMVLL